MIRVTVKNVSDEPVSRLGHTVEAGAEETFEVMNRKQAIAVRAPRAFEVLEVEIVPDDEAEEDQEPEDEKADSAEEPNGGGDSAEEPNDEEVDEEVPIHEDPEIVDPLEAATGKETPTIPEVLEAVEAGEISVEAAIEAETAGKNRSTLLDALKRIG